MGEWLEARLHLNFTEIADGMFGDGRLTREERKGLSSAIGAALDAFRSQVEAVANQLYSRDIWEDPKNDNPITEAADLDGDYIPLVEGAVRRDGTIPIKVISPGWGSSGFYAADVLERDGPKVFTSGTKMYWNHPTSVEEADRPEGDLNALAAELTTAARYDAQGKQGPGLYADAKVFGPYRESVDELAKHIGVSIRAQGKATAGEVEGKRGAIIQEITNARSIDFVTEPGAGGRIIEMFEAARPQLGQRNESSEHREGERDTAPIVEGTEGDENVDNEQLQTQLTEAQTRLAQVEQQNARLQEALLLREAREYVQGQLATTNLPTLTRERLVTQLAANPPIVEGSLNREAYATRIQEAVQAETEYLTAVAGYGSGRIEGMGGGQVTEPDAEALNSRLTESFQRMGLSEQEVAYAVRGRAI